MFVKRTSEKNTIIAEQLEGIHVECMFVPDDQLFGVNKLADQMNAIAEAYRKIVEAFEQDTAESTMS